LGGNMQVGAERIRDFDKHDHNQSKFAALVFADEGLRLSKIISHLDLCVIPAA
jgi:hypothetical protein